MEFEPLRPGFHGPNNMNILRTPDSRIENLPDWPFTAHNTQISDVATGQILRLACVDEGPLTHKTGVSG